VSESLFSFTTYLRCPINSRSEHGFNRSIQSSVAGFPGSSCSFLKTCAKRQRLQVRFYLVSNTLMSQRASLGSVLSQTSARYTLSSPYIRLHIAAHIPRSNGRFISETVASWEVTCQDVRRLCGREGDREDVLPGDRQADPGCNWRVACSHLGQQQVERAGGAEGPVSGLIFPLAISGF
jgi:hypothetical protein